MTDTSAVRLTQAHVAGYVHYTFDVADDAVIPAGAQVKITDDRTVAIAGPTDTSIGICHVPKNNWHNNISRVGVLTKFNAVLVGVASEAIVAGDKVAQLSGNAEAVTFRKAVNGDFVAGIAFTSAALGGDVEVGLYV